MKYMGIDVGTTGVKATVFDEAGNSFGYGFCGYDIMFGENKVAEQDAEKVWLCTKEVMKEAAASCGSEIISISLSTQGDAVIPVDRNRNALAYCQLGMDYRGEKETQKCIDLFGDENLYNITGMRAHPLNSVIKMMWFAEHNGDFDGKLWKYTTYADYILLKLGSDEPVIDYSMASRVMAMDMQTNDWSDATLSGIGISKEFLSKPMTSGRTVGTIEKTVAEETGINPDAKLVTGGHDQPCAALGAGVIAEGSALDSHGTAEVLSTCFGRADYMKKMYEGYYPCTRHVVDDMFFTFALNHTGGLLLQWFKNTLCEKDIEEAQKISMDPYTYLIGNTPDVPASVMVLPHFNGSGTPWCDLQSKGAILGLTMDTSRMDIIKAVLDSLTYEMKINLNCFEEASIPVKRIMCCGGAAKSEKWLQLKADILERTVETLEVREAACLGAAMLAAEAVGTFASAGEAADAMVRIKKRYEPVEENVKQYKEKFEIYKTIYETCKPLHAKMV